MLRPEERVEYVFLNLWNLENYVTALSAPACQLIRVYPQSLPSPLSISLSTHAHTMALWQKDDLVKPVTTTFTSAEPSDESTGL